MTETTHLSKAEITADPDLPAIRIVRDFQASPAQVVAAHTDPEIFVKWIGCNYMTARIDHWDQRTGGSWAYTTTAEGEEYSFFGSFHEIGEDRVVQTFTYTGFPHSVSLETLTVTDLGDGWSRLTSVSLFDSYEAREGMLASGMESGVQDGYAVLDTLFAA